MTAVLSIVAPFRSRQDLQLALDVAVTLAVAQLRANPRFPLLYQSGVRYSRDVCLAPRVPGACERFLTPVSALAESRAGMVPGLDCDDLAIWRAAELRVRFGKARARAVPIRSPGIGWHVLVEHGDGQIEDPSVQLGMNPSTMR